MSEPTGQEPKVTDGGTGARESVAESRAQSEVAATLRAARLAAGIDLRKAAESLRIRYPYLEAIEAGRFADLPGHTYALGFVRAYAEFLGLDGKQVVRRFKEEEQGPTRRIALVFPSPVQEGRFPGGSVLVFAVTLAAAVYGGWYYWEHREPRGTGEVASVPSNLAAVVMPKPQAPQQSPASVAPATLPQVRTEAGASDAPAPKAVVGSQPGGAQPKGSLTTETGAAAIAVVPPPGQPADTPPASVNPASKTAPAEVAGPASPAAPGSAGEAAPTAAREEAKPPAPQQAAALPPAESHVYGDANAGSRITLAATLDSWMEVRDASGKIMSARLLRAGDSYRVPNQSGLVLMTGNAGGLVVIVDGKPMPALGPAGAVRRNIRLDPDKLAGGAPNLERR